MEAEKSLSEIARSVLVDRPDGDPKSLREKAGLLALLNLLGIVEAFYGVSDEGATATKSQAMEPVKGLELAPAAGQVPSRPQLSVSQTPPGQAAPPAPGTPDSPFSMVSALAKLMAGAASAQSSQTGVQAGSQTGAQTGTPQASGAPFGSSLASLLASLDPALIASMIGLLSGIAKARPQRLPTRVEGEQVDATTAASRPSGAEGGAAEDSRSSGGEIGADADQAASATGGASSGQPTSGQTGPALAAPASPLQQILGIDPRILTLMLNVVAELMKSRGTEQKDKAPEPRAEREDKAVEAPATAFPDKRLVAPRGPWKSPLGPRLYHKPGLGIYRSDPRPAKPTPGVVSEERQ